MGGIYLRVPLKATGTVLFRICKGNKYNVAVKYFGDINYDKIFVFVNF